MTPVVCDKCNGSGFVSHMTMGLSGDTVMYKCIICGSIANFYFVCNCEADIHNKRSSRNVKRKRGVNTSNSKIHT